MTNDNVEQRVKSFLSENYVKEDGAAKLTETTPLISSGLLDSLATLELVSFLEDTYGIEVAASEVGVHHLNTISEIARFVREKQ